MENIPTLKIVGKVLRRHGICNLYKHVPIQYPLCVVYDVLMLNFYLISSQTLIVLQRIWWQSSLLRCSFIRFIHKSECDMFRGKVTVLLLLTGCTFMNHTVHPYNRQACIATSRITIAISSAIDSLIKCIWVMLLLWYGTKSDWLLVNTRAFNTNTVSKGLKN